MQKTIIFEQYNTSNLNKNTILNKIDKIFLELDDPLVRLVSRLLTVFILRWIHNSNMSMVDIFIHFFLETFALAFEGFVVVARLVFFLLENGKGVEFAPHVIVVFYQLLELL